MCRSYVVIESRDRALSFRGGFIAEEPHVCWQRLGPGQRHFRFESDAFKSLITLWNASLGDS